MYLKGKSGTSSSDVKSYQWDPRPMNSVVIPYSESKTETLPSSQRICMYNRETGQRICEIRDATEKGCSCQKQPRPVTHRFNLQTGRYEPISKGSFACNPPNHLDDNGCCISADGRQTRCPVLLEPAPESQEKGCKSCSKRIIARLEQDYIFKQDARGNLVAYPKH